VGERDLRERNPRNRETIRGAPQERSRLDYQPYANELGAGEILHQSVFGQKNSIGERSGNAEFPTVRLAAGRVGNGARPKIEDIIPYSDEFVTQIHDGKAVPTAWDKTGLVIEECNWDILRLAYRAAIVYYVSGDEDYAKFAADIIWVFCRGAAQQEQVNPDEKGGSMGFLSYETPGDSRRYREIPLTYDLIYPYLDSVYFSSDEYFYGIPGQEKWAAGHPKGKKWAFEQFNTMFRKMIDNKLTRGGGLEGNWNLNEHESAILYAMALDDDAKFSDGHGRRYYLDQLLFRTTETNGAYCDVLRANVDPETGLWPEAPAGYGQGAIQQLIEFAFWYRKQGIDLFQRDPLLMKAATAFPSIAFPNGRSTAWGDGGYQTIYTLQAELMIAYARSKGDRKLEEQFTGLIHYAGKRELYNDLYMNLFFFVPELMKSENTLAMPRASISPAHALFIGRNMREKAYDSIAYSVYGIPKNAGHFHENGLAMEIFGRGEVLGCDFGAGPNYWDMQHRRFNRMAAGHNTVVVNGLEIGTHDAMPLTIHAADPMPHPGDYDVKGKSQNHQFSDISTVLPLKEVNADMRRVNAIVRINDTSGFLVDIFRVKVTKGEGKTYDYLYHNMGTGLTHNLKGENTAEFDQESGYGYDYLTPVAGFRTKSNITVEIPCGKDEIAMLCHIPEEQFERDFFDLRSPANFRHNLTFLKNTPVPTFLIRRTDHDLWNKPFVVVYEPVGKHAPPQISHVELLETEPGLSAVQVHLKNHDVITILSSTEPETTYQVGKITFRGTFGIVTNQECYSGDGTDLNVSR